MSNKLKIYVYPDAQKHVQDTIETKYSNTVPFSHKGILNHCDLVSVEEADYYYMGQITCGTKTPEIDDFKYFVGNEDKHIIDCEGDWFNKDIPSWLDKSLISLSGVKKKYSDMKIFTRPALSYLLIDIIRNNRKVRHTFENNRIFAFKGLPDPRGIRIKAAEACKMAGVKTNIVFNNGWQGKSIPGSKITSDYCKLILQNTFSLCPSGTGVDSVRFFEVCFFSRIPVVVGENFTMGHEFNKQNPFYFQIDSELPTDEIAEKIKEIEQAPETQLREMSFNSKKFFEENIRNYFDDPTKSFINWMKINEK